MSSSSPPDGPAETTPLLDENHTDNVTGQLPVAEHVDESRAETDGTNRSPQFTRFHRVLYLLYKAIMTSNMLQLVFLTVLFAMNLHSSARFHSCDYRFYDTRGLTYLGILCTGFSAFNVARLKSARRPTAAFVNILIYGFTAWTLFVFVLNEIIIRLHWNGIGCRSDLDDPNSSVPGSYAECLDWQHKYNLVFWGFIALDALLLCLDLAIVATFFTKLYKERGQADSEGWTSVNLPAGQLSFITFRWEPTRPHDNQARSPEA